MGGLVGVRVAAALTVLVLVVSGCVEPSGSAASTSGGSSAVVEATTGIFLKPGAGIVAGTVVNDAGFALKDVHVALVGSDFFGKTKKDGSFEFVNVSAGSWRLRVEASQFQSHEEDLVVRAGNVTKAHVVMVPVEETGAGYRPHVHDFWLDQTEKTIMDEDVDLRKTTRNTGGVGGTSTQQTLSSVTYAAQNSSDNLYRIPLPGNGDPPALIFPGTKEVQVTVSWTSSSFTGTKVGLHYRTAGVGDTVWAGRKASGETWKISVVPEGWDTGHQRFSLWEFWVRPYQDPNDGANFRPGVINGNFHVKVVVVKGEIMAEPGHEDFWAAGSTYNVNKPEDRLGECNNAYHLTDRSWGNCKLAPKNIVPPGTAKLVLESAWTYYQADGTASGDLVVVYRSPAQNPWKTHITEFQVATCQPPQAQKVKCEIVLKKGETDAFYQKRSMWSFSMAARGHEKDPLDYEPRTFTFRLTVDALRDPAYAGAGDP